MIDKIKTCRCCLEEVKNVQDLYEFSSEVAVDADSSTFVKINECYSHITDISVSADQEDLTKICSSCLGDLKFCFLFKKKCMESAKVYDDNTDYKDEVVEEYCVEEEEGEEGETVEPSTSQQHEEEQAEDQEQCYIEYVEDDDMICLTAQEQNGENDEETDDGVESEFKGDEIEYVPNKRTLLENVKHEGEGMIYNCDYCSKSFDRKEYYRRHYKRTHLQSVIEEKTDQLNAEGRTADISELQLFQCDFCGKINVFRDDHELHQSEHEGEARFKCKKCDETFGSKDDARKHLNAVHSIEDKPFNCETCSKSFKNRYQLILHNRSHTGEKPFSCPICERGFSMSSNLQKHLDTHSTEKPYQCSYCNQYFKTQRSLKFHVVCHHQKDKKIKCPSCDKSFVNKSYLKMHMLYHTGEKNFTCTICNSKYYKSSHLKRHIQNVHFKLRLMKCDYCASDFVRKETYKAHIISHHKRHLSDQEFDDALEKIRKFQPPALDINQFTVEKQKYHQQLILTKVEEGEIDMEEMIEEQIEDDNKSGVDMIVEAEDEYVEFFEEEDEDVDEQ